MFLQENDYDKFTKTIIYGTEAYDKFDDNVQSDIKKAFKDVAEACNNNDHCRTNFYDKTPYSLIKYMNDYTTGHENELREKIRIEKIDNPDEFKKLFEEYKNENYEAARLNYLKNNENAKEEEIKENYNKYIDSHTNRVKEAILNNLMEKELQKEYVLYKYVSTDKCFSKMIDDFMEYKVKQFNEDIDIKEKIENRLDILKSEMLTKIQKVEKDYEEDIKNLKKQDLASNVSDDDKIEFEIIGDLAVQNLIEKTYPLSKNKVNSSNIPNMYRLLNEKNHIYEHSKTSDLVDTSYKYSDVGSKYHQCRGYLAKRSGSCRFCN